MKKHNFPPLITAVAVAFAFGICGAYFGPSVFGDNFEGTAIWIAIACFLFPFAVWIITRICVIPTLRRMKETNVAEQQRFYLENRDSVRGDYKKELAAIRRIRRTYVFQLICFIAGGAGASFFSWQAGPAFTGAIPLFSIAIITQGISAITVKRAKLEDFTTDCVAENDFPYLYEIARKAASKAGCSKTVRIIIDARESIMISRVCDTVLLTLGSGYIGLLSEDELYAVMLHEFSHCSDVAFPDFRHEQFVSARLFNEKEYPLPGLNRALREAYRFRYLLFYTAFSLIAEQEADKAIREGADVSACVSALVKTHLVDYSVWASAAKDQCDYKTAFSGDEPPADLPAREIRDMREDLEQNAGFWISFAKKEILSRTASHPTLKMRLDALGATGMDFRFAPSSERYEAEIKKAIDRAGELMKDLLADNFEDAKEFYAAAEESVAEWEEAGRPLDPAVYGDIVSSLDSLGRRSEAEALCIRAMNELPEPAAIYAYFYNGKLRLARFDDAGIDMIYRAINGNHNYIDEGLDIIGRYCCMTGNERELERSRENALRLRQEDVDVYSKLFTLEKNDLLTADDIPADMRERDIENIRKICGDALKEIYLVKKTVRDARTSVYILRIDDALGDEEKRKLLHGVFMYLDTVSDWQYSLYDIKNVPQIRVEKIDGALVWKSE